MVDALDMVQIIIQIYVNRDLQSIAVDLPTFGLFGRQNFLVFFCKLECFCSGEAHSWIQETTFEYFRNCLPLQENERNECFRKESKVCSTCLYVWRKSIFHVCASQENCEIYHRCRGNYKSWSWHRWSIEGILIKIIDFAYFIDLHLI